MVSLGFTQYAMDTMLNFWFRGIDASAPVARYAGALVVNPLLRDGSDAVEVDSVAHPEYARVQIEYDAPIAYVTNLPSSGGTGRKVLSSVEEIFPDADASWGTIVGIAIYDAPTGGNMIRADEVTTAKDIDTGDTGRIGVGKSSIGLKS